MTEIYPLLALLLLLNIFVGLTRVLRGPTAADRMLAAEMFSTSVVVIVLLLSVVTDRPTLVDVALVFALLSALAVVTFVSRAWHALETPTGNDRQEEDRP
ncbi:MAG: multiple resistance and pH regulation protein F [Candidatus Competibacteraceae bacterium]|jgi:multicomponent Na+:H+ antiporter subunit F|nr:MAG: multiple resistance and pH regulation protein F [Candidatus Competibacteraceae bacterium]